MNFSSLLSGWLGWALGGLAVVAIGVGSWFVLTPPKAEAPGDVPPPAQVAALPEATPEAPASADAPVAATPSAEQPPAQSTPLLPSFDVVRVEPDGSALVAGRAEPGAKVSVLVDGNTVASTKADPGAGFVAMFDLATSPNDRVMTLETELADGTKLASEVSVIVEGVEPPRVLAQADTGVAEPGATEPATAEASPSAAPTQSEPAPAAENAPDTAQDTAQTTAPDAPTPGPDTAAPAAAATEPASQMAPQTAPNATPDATPDSAAPAQAQTATPANVEPANVEAANAAPAGASATAGGEASAQPEPAQPGSTQPETGQTETAQTETAQTETGQPETPAAAPAEPAPEPQAPRLLLAGPDGLRVLQDTGPEPQLSLDAITYDAAGEVGLSGRGQADETLQVYVDNTPVTTAEVGESGAWQVPLPDVGAGVHTLRVDSVDADGSVVRRVETPFHREDKDVLAAASSEAAATGQPLAAITVQPGNTLWAIAEGRYGEGIKYWTIFDANRDQIRDPHWIYPGQVFALPQENP